MDEAAAKLRVALYSLPDDLKEMKTEIDRLLKEEEQAGVERNYERAAQMKSDRLRAEEEFNTHRDIWEQEHKLDEIVDVNDIAEVINQWTGIPVSQMMEDEKDKLLQMEDRLHERLIGQDEAIVAVSDAIRRARSGLKDPAGQLVPLCSSVLPVWARRNWPKRWLNSCSMMKKRWCGLT